MLVMTRLVEVIMMVAFGQSIARHWIENSIYITS